LEKRKDPEIPQRGQQWFHAEIRKLEAMAKGFPFGCVFSSGGGVEGIRQAFTISNGDIDLIGALHFGMMDFPFFVPFSCDRLIPKCNEIIDGLC
jgi:hypothetical protein